MEQQRINTIQRTRKKIKERLNLLNEDLKKMIILRNKYDKENYPTYRIKELTNNIKVQRIEINRYIEQNKTINNLTW